MMRMICRTALLVVVGVVISSPATFAQTRPGGALVDLLVFGADVISIDVNAYSADLKAPIERHITRYKSYRSKRPTLGKSGLEKMVHTAWVRYEARLAAVSDDPRAPALAMTYVDRLRPCYEWEGFHDCPEREARFARDYRAVNSTGPFSDYLPLLEAHRWLCAAEGYDYEERPQDGVRSRREFEAALGTARKSASALIRLAAEELAVRRKCLPPDR